MKRLRPLTTLLAGVLAACAVRPIRAGEAALPDSSPGSLRPIASDWPDQPAIRFAAGVWEEFEQPDQTPRALFIQELVDPVESRPPATSNGKLRSGEMQPPRFDPAEVEQGQSAFDNACSQCHDTDRALAKRKSRAGWFQTARRMAAKDGADIAAGDIGPIATYLASIRGAVAKAGEGGLAESLATGLAGLGPGLSINGTLAPIWRGGNDNLEKPGFFPDTWVSANWQPTSPLTGRVTACTTCHSDQFGGGGFTLELAEAFAELDLTHRLKRRAREQGRDAPVIDANIKAGRFLVPFGAYSTVSHPGAYRTLTNPLMYIMGRNVAPSPSRPPVLPMPYADEGADLHANLQICCNVTATLDAYAVNGLQAAGSGISFVQSRGYVDNNNNTAVGGRATIGNRSLRFGGSVMSGDMQDDRFHTSTFHYQFAGGDVVARFGELLRVYYEYAIRRNDATFSPIQQIAFGNVVEAELLLKSEPRISLLARFDNLEHRDSGGSASLERFTWGVNATLPGGSLLIFNHEHWDFRSGEPDIDVLGFRWVTTF